MKRQLAILIVLVVAATAVWFSRGAIRNWLIEARMPAVPAESARPASTASTPEPTAFNEILSLTPTPRPTVGAVNLAVPFYTQAPRGDWSLPWQEACEEASAILVDLYWQEDDISTEEMEARILALVGWQTERFGYYEHTTAEETAVILRDIMGYERVDVEYDFSVDDIIAHVRDGRPVIVPLAGRLLGNPHYTEPGPIYHMLVVKGVTDDGDLITNDVGTRHGQNYVYDPAVFAVAMHDVPGGGSDWPEGVDPVEYIQTGARAIVVVYPN